MRSKLTLHDIDLQDFLKTIDTCTGDVFLETEFEGGRHQRRIDQIMEIENS